MRLAVVIPVKNRAALLSRCLTALMPAVRDAVANGHEVDIVVSDNGSNDETVAMAQQHAPVVRVAHSTAACVGGVRNDGARAAAESCATADAYVFLDADCLVPPDFVHACAEVFADSGADAVGCEVRAPVDGHWTERAWDALHRPGGDGPRHYINSACFAIRPDAFAALDGFDATRPSSEDVDICQRLVARGGRLFQSERLAVLHLGNPQSLGAFWRRIAWHNEGVFDAMGRMQRSPMVYATLAHGVVLLLSVVVSASCMAAGAPWLAIGILLGGLLMVPMGFVVARRRQFRRPMPLIASTALMALTFPARLHGMWRGWVRRRPIPSRLAASS